MSVKSCSDVRDDLELYALHLLEDGERIFVDAHIVECDACRIRLEALHEVVADPETWEEPPPIDPERQALQREKLMALVKLQSRWIAAGDYEIWSNHQVKGFFWVEPVQDESTINIFYEKDGKKHCLVSDVKVFSSGQFELDSSIIEKVDKLRCEGIKFEITCLKTNHKLTEKV